MTQKDKDTGVAVMFTWCTVVMGAVVAAVTLGRRK